VKNLYTLEGRSFNGTRTTPEFGLAAGSLTPKDFTLLVYNGNPRPESFSGKSVDTSGKGQIVKLSPGEYNVILVSPYKSPYITEMSHDCNGTIILKEVKECIVTHTFIGRDTLKVVTKVDSTGGGTANPEDFSVLVNYGSPIFITGTPYPGKEVSLFPVMDISRTLPYFAYMITPVVDWFEHPHDPPGYIIGASERCKLYETYVIYTVGDTRECTYTYKFVGKAVVKVITTVINTGGGTAKSEDFGFHIDNNGVIYGTEPPENELELSAGLYHVIAGEIPSYSHSESSACWGAIAMGETKECQITYTFKGP
jgi:hypothetical protein